MYLLRIYYKYLLLIQTIYFLYYYFFKKMGIDQEFFINKIQLWSPETSCLLSSSSADDILLKGLITNNGNLSAAATAFLSSNDDPILYFNDAIQQQVHSHFPFGYPVEAACQTSTHFTISSHHRLPFIINFFHSQKFTYPNYKKLFVPFFNNKKEMISVIKNTFKTFFDHRRIYPRPKKKYEA
ncbi:uncharacterized protein BX663DRAFT_496663 [Cokeromyces recurvatus]|uniref:uncharacterized protein n=1 Tax=Cokeromyces recurvatus TaxID=90255 RepID=UPI00221F4FAA|nr:uncharacterized protein BX663DRAFT_496663 [Cokeromyces recurvatus]KAI7906489.1 hypothetical protein BX663DRAFT_496663 [Cokeromyces recurvatus]